MKKFLNQNFVLVIGIALPIAMIIFFALANVIPSYFVSPPRYNLIFSANNNYYSDNGLSFNVTDGKLKAQFVCDNTCATRRYWSRPELYLFDVHTKQIKKIQVTLPAVTPNSKPFNVTINIPELDNVKIDPSTTAPDGYSFGYSSDNDGLITDVFFGGNTSRAVITKNSNTISVTPDRSRNSGYQNVKLIGWIINDKGG